MTKEISAYTHKQCKVCKEYKHYDQFTMHGEKVSYTLQRCLTCNSDLKGRTIFLVVDIDGVHLVGPRGCRGKIFPSEEQAYQWLHTKWTNFNIKILSRIESRS